MMVILCRISALVMLLLVPLSCTYRILKDHTIPSDKAHPLTSGQFQNKACQKVPDRVLRQVLGSSYNDYYMSFDPPERFQFKSDSRKQYIYKRGDSDDDGPAVNRPFFVQQDLEVVLSEEPAWKVDFAVDHVKLSKGGLQTPPADSEMGHHRAKRSAPDKILDAIGQLGDTSFKWHCEAPLRWMDLGQDYFPRYILSVDCNYHGCQGPRFKCEPRSFAIKVLRKREGVCTSGFSIHEDTLQIGFHQMPYSLSELWIWEMRAIAFCCVCQFK